MPQISQQDDSGIQTSRILDKLNDAEDAKLGPTNSMTKQKGPHNVVVSVEEIQNESVDSKSQIGGSISPIKSHTSAHLPPQNTVAKNVAIVRPGAKGPPGRGGRPGPPASLRPPQRPGPPVPQKEVQNEIEKVLDKDLTEDNLSITASEIKSKSQTNGHDEDTIQSQFQELRVLTDELKTSKERELEERISGKGLPSGIDSEAMAALPIDLLKENAKKSPKTDDQEMVDSADLFNKVAFRKTEENGSLVESPSKDSKILDRLDLDDGIRLTDDAVQPSLHAHDSPDDESQGETKTREGMLPRKKLDQLGLMSKQISIIPNADDDNFDSPASNMFRDNLNLMNSNKLEPQESEIWASKLNDFNEPAKNETLEQTDTQNSVSLSPEDKPSAQDSAHPVSKFAPSPKPVPAGPPPRKLPPGRVPQRPPGAKSGPPAPKLTQDLQKEDSLVIKSVIAPFETDSKPDEPPPAKLFDPFQGRKDHHDEGHQNESKTIPAKMEEYSASLSFSPNKEFTMTPELKPPGSL